MGQKVERFEDLKVWQDAVQIAVEIYRITSESPLAKDFSIRDQLRRSAVSISNNIVEGFEYNSNRSFIRFLKYSKGSAGELRSNLVVLKEAGILEAQIYTKLQADLMTVSQSIEALIRYLRNFENKKMENEKR